jgi:pimeloyl-ACP methyl ester carboxylesterase
MPTIEREGATIYYEGHGSGFPLLLLAPGGLNSSIPFWERMLLNPIAAYRDEFRVIAMDQRNAGRSSGPLAKGDPWDMFAADQLAVLDHLGIDRALMIGCCIGCSFILELCERHPERIVAGVMMQPIGTDESNPGTFGERPWRAWGEALIENGAKLSMDEVAAFGTAMFEPGFVFSVSREFVPTVTTPLMLLYGNDLAHPHGISVELASLLPNMPTVERWRDEDVVPEVTEQIREFLRANTPVGVR